MIYTTLNGRCGNQLFAYAMTKEIQYLTGDEQIVFCDACLREENDPSFRNELISFRVSSYEISHERGKQVFLHGSIVQKIVYFLFKIHCRIPYKQRVDFYRRQERWQPVLNKFGIYEITHGFSPIKTGKVKNKFINGYFEDKKWFPDVREDLLRELKPRMINHFNDDLYDKICTSESVCISIRRGDFLSNKLRGVRDICDENYFRKAIEIMKDKVPNATFIFFSDEIDWVKENYNFGVPSFYETGNDGVAEKLRLMSGCKHFVLSNSTFSWWAQYLSTNEKKVVISPDHWLIIPGYKHQLIEDSWILIEC